MGKVAFLPFSLGSGLVAGVIAKKLFAVMWGWVDDQEPPKPEHRNVPIGKLLLAVALEGMVFSLTRGLVDHGSRRAFERLTGSWPGDAEPERE
ncbi:MAG TPA: DUF4235 domain-containing protein [Solirubrobacteraceae bacterium]|jgi:hypothetical protein|nr:DUF4235 domain-containing protein [Solirubrobacteraceae bacterium]